MSNRLDKAGFTHFWERLKFLLTGLDNRVTALEQGGGGDDNVIESISVNGVNVPPVNKNVDITIPQQDNLGIYIDASGYICQRIRSDT
jgi:hypothetical protein